MMFLVVVGSDRAAVGSDHDCHSNCCIVHSYGKNITLRIDECTRLCDVKLDHQNSITGRIVGS